MRKLTAKIGIMKILYYSKYSFNIFWYIQVNTFKVYKVTVHPAGNYMFKVNNRNTRAKCEICPKLTIKTQERRSSVFFVNFEHISHLVLVFLLLTLSK